MVRIKEMVGRTALMNHSVAINLVDSGESGRRSQTGARDREGIQL